MEIEDELFIEDDIDILDIIDFGFPRRIYLRPNYFESMDDIAFVRRFRLRKETTLHVLELIEDELEFGNDLNNSVSPMNQLLTALLFYASDSHQINIGDFMHGDQSTVSRIVKKVSEIIAGLRASFVQIPLTPEDAVSVQNTFYRIASFPCVIGCIDGTHIKIRSPGGDDEEVYRNTKSYFSINVQIVSDADHKISNIVARWPGSTHDATIFNHSRLRTRFKAGEFRNGIILGDSGYPLKPYLLTPFANLATRAQQLYNESHIRTRNSVERTIGIWKRRFPCLSYGLHCEMETSLTIIVATTVLNIIARAMHEEVPPPPLGINMEELDYLVQKGGIAVINPRENLMQDFHNDILNNYFANLQ